MIYYFTDYTCKRMMQKVLFSYNHSLFLFSSIPSWHVFVMIFFEIESFSISKLSCQSCIQGGIQPYSPRKRLHEIHARLPNLKHFCRLKWLSKWGETRERNVRSDSCLPECKIWTVVDWIPVVLKGISPIVSGSEWHFWILSNGCPPFLATQNWARQITNSIFYLHAEHYTRCFGEGCQVYIWCIDTAAYSILALNLFSKVFFLRRTGGWASSSLSRVMPSIGFWNWPPDTHLCFLRDPGFNHLGKTTIHLIASFVEVPIDVQNFLVQLLVKTTILSIIFLIRPSGEITES